MWSPLIDSAQRGQINYEYAEQGWNARRRDAGRVESEGEQGCRFAIIIRRRSTMLSVVDRLNFSAGEAMAIQILAGNVSRSTRGGGRS
jgi:hypothetical protein